MRLARDTGAIGRSAARLTAVARVEDWRDRPEGFVEFVNAHDVPSFVEYGEYPYVTSDEVKKAPRLKAAFSDMLEQMQ
jgi:hypothetical protein